MSCLWIMTNWTDMSTWSTSWHDGQYMVWYFGHFRYDNTGKLTTKLYDKLNDFLFSHSHIVNFPFLIHDTCICWISNRSSCLKIEISWSWPQILSLCFATQSWKLPGTQNIRLYILDLTLSCSNTLGLPRGVNDMCHVLTLPDHRILLFVLS